MSDDPPEPLCLTEGPETGLSVWIATGHETWIALGSMAKHKPPTGRIVVACRDDDPPQSAADKAFSRAQAEWSQKGVDIRVATPWAERRGDKSDFNETLQVGGRDAVRRRIEAAINPEPAGGRVVRLSLADARAALAKEVAAFFADARSYDVNLTDAVISLAEDCAREVWATASDEVREFKATKEAVHAARTKGLKKIEDARAAYHTARLAVMTSPRGERAAARNERNRLRAAWRQIRAAVTADRRDEAARLAAIAAERGSVAEGLRGEFAKYTRETTRLARERGRQQSGPAPVDGIRVDVGGGKSTEARRLAAAQLAAMRAAGDKRTGVFLVPTIDLADEQADLFRALPEVGDAGLTVAVWRGRERSDPDHPGQAMCRDLDAVEDAKEALADVQTSVCQRKDADGTVRSKCQHFDECSYQKQRAARADLWFAAHEMAFERKPAAMGKPAFVIIDESVWQDGLIGIGSGRPLALDTLSRGDRIPDAPLATERLQFLRQRMFDALCAQPDGPIPRAAIDATGLTSESADEARALEWRRKVDAAIFPGMRKSDRKAAVKAAEINKTIGRLSLFWRAIEDLMQSGGPTASGWVALTMSQTREGAVRMLDLKGRKDVGEAYHVPTLILDATMQPEPLRYFWPALKVTADIAIQARHQHVLQVQDRSYSKNHLRQGDKLRDVRAILFRVAREYAPGRVLCVIQKAFEEELIATGNLPVNLVLAHHNAISGKDGWKDVVALFVVGRTAPSPQSMEQLAEALSGEAIPHSPTWYPQSDVTREMADGSFRSAQLDRHPHPLVEACRWSVAESEVVQIIGRARGCNRTEQDPVDVWVLSNVPLPMPVNRLISASHLIPSPGDLMAAVGGVELANPTDASDAYPNLWHTREAAKSAMTRATEANLGANSYRRLLIRECTQVPATERPSMARAEYQRVGRGQRVSVAWFDLVLVPDPAAWLTKQLGALSHFELIEPEYSGMVSPEQAAMRVMATRSDEDKFRRRIALRPSPPEYHEGCVPLVADGYGNLLNLFPGMKPTDNCAVANFLTIARAGETLLVMATGRVIDEGSYDPFAHGP